MSTPAHEIARRIRALARSTYYGQWLREKPRIIALESRSNAHSETMGARHSSAAQVHSREFARNRVGTECRIFLAAKKNERH